MLMRGKALELLAGQAGDADKGKNLWGVFIPGMCFNEAVQYRKRDSSVFTACSRVLAG